MNAERPFLFRVYRAWFVVIIAAFSVDRIAKWLAVERWSTHPVHLLRGVDLALLLNKGIAFSIPVPTWLFFISAGVVLLVLMTWGIRAWKQGDHRAVLALFMLLVGAVSNIIDRILYDGVVDFFSVWILPVVNIADVMIVGAIILLLVQARPKTNVESP